ncbi:MAG: helix-turn-helix domain-containing protein [Bacteroidota bacterium]|nr:helix-turn-helix domain-containing protein [Bacteroidota bacterium]
MLQQIGAKIREVRQQRKMTQESLANECDVDYSQINRMELGKVNFNISYLYKIAKALQVDPKELLP